MPRPNIHRGTRHGNSVALEPIALEAVSKPRLRFEEKAPADEKRQHIQWCVSILRKRATGISNPLTKYSADFDPPSGLPVFDALPAHKPDGTGRPELAINLRVPAFEALLAEIDIMLLAFIRRVDFGMTGTFAHERPLSKYVFNNSTVQTSL